METKIIDAMEKIGLIHHGTETCGAFDQDTRLLFKTINQKVSVSVEIIDERDEDDR